MGKKTTLRLRINKLCRAWMILGVLIVLAVVMEMGAEGKELPFLNQNPELNLQLPQREQGGLIGEREIKMVAQGTTGKSETELLIDDLKKPNNDVRRRAAKRLGEMRDPRAVDPLIIALLDHDKGVRGESARALNNIVRDEQVLKNLPGQRPVDFLKAAMKNPDVRPEAARLLGMMKVEVPRTQTDLPPIIVPPAELDFLNRSPA